MEVAARFLGFLCMNNNHLLDIHIHIHFSIDGIKINCLIQMNWNVLRNKQQFV